MPQYRLGNPGITAISFGGVQHDVNADGLLEVADHLHSPELHQHITRQLGGVEPELNDAPAQTQTSSQSMSDDEAERQMLFAQLEETLGRPVDRRRSLKQLRAMMADHEAAQAKKAGSTAGNAANKPVRVKRGPAPKSTNAGQPAEQEAKDSADSGQAPEQTGTENGQDTQSDEAAKEAAA